MCVHAIMALLQEKQSPSRALLIVAGCNPTNGDLDAGDNESNLQNQMYLLWRQCSTFPRFESNG